MANPYRALFPLGILLAFLGALPWLFFNLGWLSYYPNVDHARIMVMGFFMSFVCGFLMTAVPKMARTFPARPIEVGLAVLLILLQTIVSLGHLSQISIFVGIAQFVALMVFLGVRFGKRGQNPPTSFLFVPIGILSGLAGFLLLAFSDQLPNSGIKYGQMLLYQAFLLNPIVGLGARLVPVLSRAPGALDPTQQGKRSINSYLLPALLLNLSFPVEAFASVTFGILLRFGVLTYFLLKEFQLFSKPLEPSWLGINLKIASLFLAVPYILIAIFPAYSIHLLHFVFLGGFGLITLMISVRVTLAHGAYPLTFERTAKSLPAILIFVSLSAIIRSLGPLLAPSHFKTSLNLALLFWLIATVIWTTTFLPRMKWQEFFKKSNVL